MWINIMRLCLQKALLIFLCCACSSSDDKVADTRFWKYSEGFSIGDMLDFEQPSLRLQGDTIFVVDSALAKVRKIENRWFAGDRVLHIESLKHKTIGRYVAK